MKKPHEPVVAGVRSRASKSQPSSQQQAFEAEQTSARLPIEKPTAVLRSGGSASDEHWDIVDEASWESFPASDPPAYVSGRVHDEPPERG